MFFIVNMLRKFVCIQFAYIHFVRLLFAINILWALICMAKAYIHSYTHEHRIYLSQWMYVFHVNLNYIWYNLFHPHRSISCSWFFLLSSTSTFSRLYIFISHTWICFASIMQFLQPYSYMNWNKGDFYVSEKLSSITRWDWLLRNFKSITMLQNCTQQRILQQKVIKYCL